MSVQEQQFGTGNVKRKLLLVLAIAGIIAAIPTLYRMPGSGFGADSNKSVTVEEVINPKDGKIIKLKKQPSIFNQARHFGTG